MGLYNGRLFRPTHAAAAALLGLVSIAFVPAAAHAAATAEIVKQRQWASGYVAKVTVVNPGPAAITSWRVEFDLPAGTSVTSAWSAALTRSGNHHTFTNLRWNGGLAPGASTSFGFVAHGTGDPVNCTVNAAPCAGAPLDVTPPGKPVLRTIVDPVTMTYVIFWDPPADDTGVVGYERYGKSGQVTFMTDTTTTLAGPPSLATAFGIRAVDAAGNASPAAPVIIGPFDIVAPDAPPNLRISAPAQGYLPVSWDVPYDDLLVVGYEVYLNDVLVRNVGNTKAYVPFSGYGVYKVGVRAYDSMNRFSPRAELTIAIDPPAA